MAHVLNEPKTEEELRRDVAQDHSQRDVDAVKEVQPALSRSDTRQRGDHLGSAAERGDTQQVKKLLKKGVDPNYANAASGVTPLGVASEHGHVAIAQVLLEARANVEHATTRGTRPIHAASQFGKHKVMEVLIKTGKCDVNSISTWDGLWPLIYATNFNHLESVALLLEHGADLTLRTPSGQTALHYAFSAEAVCRLVGARAHVDDCCNTGGDTPLHTAAHNGYVDVCLALFTCGAHPGWTNEEGIRPVELAIKTAGHASLACAHAMLGFNVKSRLIKQRHSQLVARHAGRLAEGELDGPLEDIDKDVARGVDPSLYADVATSVAETDEAADHDLLELMQKADGEEGPVSGATKKVKELTMKEPPKDQGAAAAEQAGANEAQDGGGASEQADATVDLVDIDEGEAPSEPRASDPKAAAKAVPPPMPPMPPSKWRNDLAAEKDPEVLKTEEGIRREAAAAILTAGGDDMGANLLLCHGRLWRWHRKLNAVAQELPGRDEWSLEGVDKEAKIAKSGSITYTQHLICRFHAIPKKNLEKAGKMMLNKMLSGAAKEREDRKARAELEDRTPRAELTDRGMEGFLETRKANSAAKRENIRALMDSE